MDLQSIRDDNRGTLRMPRHEQKRKPLWRRPRCGRKFANANQWHSCGHFSVEDHLKGKSAGVRAIYERFVSGVEACGPVTLSPVKTGIGFKVRMTFAAVTLKQHWMDGHIVMARRLDDPRFLKVESPSPRNHVYYFRLRSPEEIDDAVKSWIEDAYRVGKQEHLRE